ncbi:MAG: nitroreductase [Solirubrobacterales bacterium]|nr:nitroreductase [Solirubrobacterales bacterium]
MPTVTELLQARTSIRAFTDEPVGEEEVRQVLEAARWSPSGGNLQPWKVIVVAGEAKDEVSALAQQTLAANPFGEAGEHAIYPQPLGEPFRTRRFQVGEEMYALLGIPREDKVARLQHLARNYAFFDAPVGLFFVIDRQMGHGQWAHLGMFMQSVALVAQERGLSTCMQESWAMVRESLHAHFGLPAEDLLYCGMALGYADEDAPVNRLRSARAEVAEFAELRGF